MVVLWCSHNITVLNFGHFLMSSAEKSECVLDAWFVAMYVKNGLGVSDMFRFDMVQGAGTRRCNVCRLPLGKVGKWMINTVRLVLNTENGSSRMSWTDKLGSVSIPWAFILSRIICVWLSS